MKKKSAPLNLEQKALLAQLERVAEGLSATFAPFCEVVVHDLMDPAHSVLSIHNNLSGRTPGSPATGLGLARIADQSYRQVIANYPNQFADGRQAKSTSVGIKDSSGRYIAALCLNIDLTLFQSIQMAMGQFLAVQSDTAICESLSPASGDAIRIRIDRFAANLATTPRSLKPKDRRILLKELKESGYLDRRRSMETAALHLGVSRATVYSDLK